MSLLFTLTLQNRTGSRERPFLLKAVLSSDSLSSSASSRLQARSSLSAMGMTLIPVPAGESGEEAEGTESRIQDVIVLGV